MRIVEPASYHLTIRQAATLAGCSHKTVRRAVQQGMLLQRYVLGPHGPYLVFLHDEIKRWRNWTGLRPDRPSKRPEQHRHTAPSSPEMSAMLSDLGAALNEQAAQIHQTLETLRQVSDDLAAIEQEALVLAGDALLNVDGVPSRSGPQHWKHTG